MSHHGSWWASPGVYPHIRKVILFAARVAWCPRRDGTLEQDAPVFGYECATFPYICDISVEEVPAWLRSVDGHFSNLERHFLAWERSLPRVALRPRTPRRPARRRRRLAPRRPLRAILCRRCCARATARR